MMAEREPVRIRRLVGVYNAEGTLRGELKYWLGRRRGVAHCALCDITHGAVRERAEWKQCRAELPIPFDSYHLDDQPAEVRQLTAGRTPCVLARTQDGLVMLLGPAELDLCTGSPHRLVEAVRAAALHHGLDWPDS